MSGNTNYKESYEALGHFVYLAKTDRFQAWSDVKYVWDWPNDVFFKELRTFYFCHLDISMCKICCFNFYWRNFIYLNTKILRFIILNIKFAAKGIGTLNCFLSLFNKQQYTKTYDKYWSPRSGIYWMLIKI